MGLELKFSSIVAVHGLSGYRTTSWGLANERVEKEKTWLKDAFSERIPGARVMTFGYESDIGTRGVISSTGIKDKAVKLLEALSNKESAVPVCSNTRVPVRMGEVDAQRLAALSHCIHCP